jgi:DNA-binding transcriptional LysR family regulator
LLNDANGSSERRAQSRGDVADHRVLCFTPTMGRDIGVDLHDGNRRARIVVRRWLTSNQIAAVRHQALAGCGIAYLPIGACLPELDAGRLVPVLKRWSSGGTPIQIVYPHQRFVPLKVKAFVELAVDSGSYTSCFQQSGDPDESCWMRSIEEECHAELGTAG